VWPKVGRWAAPCIIIIIIIIIIIMIIIAAAAGCVLYLLLYGPDVLTSHDVGNVIGPTPESARIGSPAAADQRPAAVGDE
jgi:flagellar basal body-associated protein FliL